MLLLIFCSKKVCSLNVGCLICSIFPSSILFTIPFDILQMDDALSSEDENQILTQCQRENEDEFPQPPPAQQRKNVLEPYDIQPKPVASLGVLYPMNVCYPILNLTMLSRIN